MINCIAVDDEPLALKLLQDNISKVPFLKLEAACNDAFEAMKALQENKIDLVFIVPLINLSIKNYNFFTSGYTFFVAFIYCHKKEKSPAQACNMHCLITDCLKSINRSRKIDLRQLCLNVA